MKGVIETVKRIDWDDEQDDNVGADNQSDQAINALLCVVVNIFRIRFSARFLRQFCELMTCV